MRLLDCESISNAYDSVMAIIGIEKDKLDAFIEHFDNEKFCNEYIGLTDEGYVAPFVRGLIAEHDISTNYDFACWFHLTRVSPETKFENGLLPTHEAIEYIWNHLFTLTQMRISEAEWSAFRSDVESNISHRGADFYRTKAMGQIHGGPYAMLIRESADYPQELGNHDYLSVPEIVEDICCCLADTRGIDLLADYKSTTVPTIVKFTEKTSGIQYLDRALAYIAYKRRGEEVFSMPNAYFSALGFRVSADSIMSIETKDQLTRQWSRRLLR